VFQYFCIIKNIIDNFSLPVEFEELDTDTNESGMYYYKLEVLKSNGEKISYGPIGAKL